MNHTDNLIDELQQAIDRQLEATKRVTDQLRKHEIAGNSRVQHLATKVEAQGGVIAALQSDLVKAETALGTLYRWAIHAAPDPTTVPEIAEARSALVGLGLMEASPPEPTEAEIQGALCDYLERPPTVVWRRS